MLICTHRERRLSFRSLLTALFVLTMVSGKALQVKADEPPVKPLLRVETGTHTAVIKDLAVDAQETYFVTGAMDGTARIWDLASGELRKTLRVPYGNGDGLLYSVAISPDGKQIACAGFTGFMWDKSVCVYLFDSATGDLTKRLTGLPDVVQVLRYAPDGKNLVVGLGSKNGMRVLNVANGSETAADKEYDGDCFGMDFRPDGWLVTGALDGMVRLYSPDFKLQIRRKAPGGTHPHGVAFSPDGEKIAVGFGDTHNLNVLAMKDLSLLYAPATDDIKFAAAAFDTVAWSRDGKKLFAAGRVPVINGETVLRVIRRYDDGGKGKFVDIAAAGEVITALRPLKIGPMLYAAGDPLWGVLDGDKARLFEAPTVDMRTTTFLLSDDASVVQISALPNDTATIRFSAAQRKLETGLAKTTAEAEKVGKSAGLHPAIIGVSGVELANWENGMHPKVNGHSLELNPNESSRCLAFLPDHKRFLLGCDYSLRMVNVDGTQEWILPTNGIVWQVNVSKDGETGVVLLNDGTVRWLRTKEPELLLSLFPLTDQKQWVAWTSSGYYDASAGSEDLIGWHVNRGKARQADFFPASRFRATFYRPDVVERVLKAGGEAEALRLADADRGRKTQVVDVNKTLPPVITLKSPENNAEVSEASVKAQFTVRTPGDAPVISTRALIDGRPAGAARRIQEVATDKEAETLQTLDVTLPARDCELSIIAENKNGTSAPVTVHLHWKGGAADITKPKLYVLAVGVSKYKNPAYALDFAAKDASDFADTLKQQSGKLYRDVEVRLLTDDQAGKDAVLDGLEWIQKQTTARDVAMIFLSGHGVRDGSGDYYYVPYNFDIEKKRSTGVLFYEIEKTIKDIAGKTLFFVDTCHSGSAGGVRTRGVEPDIVSIVNELSSAENGAIVFAASTGKEYALEDVKWGHGAFTKALLEGLSGKADLRGDGRVTVTSLDFFLSERVKELTEGAQHPTTTKPPSVPDFPIAIVK